MLLSKSTIQRVTFGFIHCRVFEFVRFVVDNSTLSGVQQRVECGFWLFNHFAVFIYSLFQNIRPDRTLGNVFYRDNEDFHKLVLASKMPRPSKLSDQSIFFCKAFCNELLGHEIVMSVLIRGMSSYI